MASLRVIQDPKTVLILALAGVLTMVIMLFSWVPNSYTVGVLVLVACVTTSGLLYSAPKLQAAAMTTLTEKERFDVENESRKTMAQILGGAVLIAGLYFTWRTTRVSEVNLIETQRQEAAKLDQERRLSDQKLDADRNLSEEQARTQSQIADRQKRFQAFRDLMGEKFLISEFHITKLDADINVQYDYARWTREDSQMKPIIYDDLKDQLHWGQQMILEIAKKNEELFQTVGMVTVLYPSSPELKRITKRIYQTGVMEVQPPHSGITLAELEAWKKEAYSRSQEFVEKQYERPITELLNYMAAELEKEGRGGDNSRPDPKQ
jgi:hypothetical protein